MRSLVAVAVVACSAIACGGGSDSTAPTAVPTTSFTPPAQSALAGDWPGAYNYYLVRDQQHWDQVWAERQAVLDCSRSYNASACSSAQPPAVEFGQYMVIGVYLGQGNHFAKPSERLLIYRDTRGLVVDFQVVPVVGGSPPASTLPEVEFFARPNDN